ncbi:hypothetical protein BD309DRAFT_963967 [Dichomitus squalens]|uniref:Uncharacterized protein n=2 Tax=Dichomitus squalens TaxID=114155 RepID=A0A4Q9MHA2_9APHY|nr:uncharacterized protein DICSQDRAFT_136061 [Dichomitus squalens LYAD-421 SS1]EJF61935.1 hypothetical protein DICSQDRAFT_136061 [Dichomitus squalens LYAD-421 SS1]TBU25266.1 hypothetical protein BD311DRAFT_506144 [Dichomitus squalens]TBU42054.1 hypothetical protein BD309DRAFT_963967 [Dichomitus squalens]TBU52691.1 hypothetical protein BD310DRAFT_209081 [Dichomitus squalens]
MPKKAPSVKDYLDGIDVSKVTSGLWAPAKQWNRLHGDGKSTTGGSYHIETIHGSDGVYKAKVVGPGGATKVEVEWAAATNPAPTVATVIAALKAKA